MCNWYAMCLPRHSVVFPPFRKRLCCFSWLVLFGMSNLVMHALHVAPCLLHLDGTTAWASVVAKWHDPHRPDGRRTFHGAWHLQQQGFAVFESTSILQGSMQRIFEEETDFFSDQYGTQVYRTTRSNASRQIAENEVHRCGNLRESGLYWAHWLSYSWPEE